VEEFVEQFHISIDCGLRAHPDSQHRTANERERSTAFCAKEPLFSFAFCAGGWCSGLRSIGLQNRNTEDVKLV